METILFSLVIALCVILILMLGVVAYFLFRYLKLKESEKITVEEERKKSLEDRMPLEVRQKVNEAQELSKSLVGQFCVDHPEIAAKGTCSISGEHYCELCITKEKDVRIARKFLNLFLDTDWQDTFFFNNKMMGEDKINELMRVKNELWQVKSVPVIAQKQFKINIETDDIEIYTVVMTRQQDDKLIESRLGFLKSE